MGPLQALQPGAAAALDAATLEAIAGDVPSASLDKGQVVGQALVQVMVAAGLQPSKAASKRLIKVGADDCALPNKPSTSARLSRCKRESRVFPCYCVGSVLPHRLLDHGVAYCVFCKDFSLQIQPVVGMSSCNCADLQ